jgi:tRNA nucleotidyltransferase/poly(A) polymerase
MQQLQQPSWSAARRANAAARDFTVNALLYDPFQAVLFDYVGGVTDAQRQLLRCVGDAAARFKADPACLLRAVRCAARAGEICLDCLHATRLACVKHATQLCGMTPGW